MSFLGDEVVEFFFWDNTVLVKISSFDHLLEDIIVSEFSEVLSNFSEVLKGDVSWVKQIVPVFCGSKVMKTLWTSSLDSLSDGLVVIM